MRVLACVGVVCWSKDVVEDELERTRPDPSLDIDSGRVSLDFSLERIATIALPGYHECIETRKAQSKNQAKQQSKSSKCVAVCNHDMSLQSTLERDPLWAHTLA